MTTPQKKPLVFVPSFTTGDGVQAPDRRLIRRYCQPRTKILPFEEPYQSQGSTSGSDDETPEVRNSEPPSDDGTSSTTSDEPQTLQLTTKSQQSLASQYRHLFSRMDPFDATPLASEFFSNCIRYYAEAMDLHPWTAYGRDDHAERNRALVLRRETWLPLAMSSTFAYSALLAFILTAPTLPKQMQSDPYARQALGIALKRLRAALTGANATSDVTVFAIALLEHTACHMGDVAAVDGHTRGLQKLIQRRHSTRPARTPTPSSTSSTPPPFEPTPTTTLETPRRSNLHLELGFTELHESGLLSQDYSCPYRRHLCTADAMRAFDEDDFLWSVAVSHRDGAWNALGPPRAAPRSAPLRPLEHAVRAAIPLLSLRIMRNRDDWARQQVARLGSDKVDSIHDSLFEGEREAGLAEAGRAHPGVLAWLALVAGRWCDRRGQRRDFCWLLRKAMVDGLGIWRSVDSFLDYMAVHFTWPETLEAGFRAFVHEAARAFPIVAQEWANQPYIRPRM